MFASLPDRASALLGRLGALAWLCVLVPIPLVTDLLESGSLPRSPREWITEIVAGSVIAGLVAKVRRSHRMLESQARTDGLTGLGNRHLFKTTIDIECARARRSGAPLSVVYMDLDRFKQINDRHGHAAGDRILKQFAQAIREAIRAHVDAAFRLGGDEFALVLPSSTGDQAGEIVERLRSSCAVRDPLWAVGAVDFSAGIVELDSNETAESLLARSDAAINVSSEARTPIRRQPDDERSVIGGLECDVTTRFWRTGGNSPRSSIFMAVAHEFFIPRKLDFRDAS